MSLTGIPINHRNFDLPLPGIFHVSDPNYFRYALPDETPVDFAERLGRELEETILREGPETVAAFIAEPVTGAVGLPSLRRPITKGFSRYWRATKSSSSMMR